MITSGVVEHDWKPFFPDRIPRRDAARQTPLSTAFLDRRRFLSCKMSTLNRITTSTRLTGHSLYWIQLQVCVTSAPHKTWFWLCYQLSSTGKGAQICGFFKNLFINSVPILQHVVAEPDRNVPAINRRFAILGPIVSFCHFSTSWYLILVVPSIIMHGSGVAYLRLF